MRKTLLIVCISLMTSLAACGGGETPKAKDEHAGEPKAGEPAAPAAASGAVMGKISFEGEAVNPKIQMKADPKCPQDPNAKAEDYVVTDGGLDNVIVYISSDVKKGPAPTEKK